MTHSCRERQVLAEKKADSNNILDLGLLSVSWQTKYTWLHLNQTHEVMGGASTYFAACCSSSSRHPDRKFVSLGDTYSLSAFSLPAFSAVTAEAFNRGFSETVALWNISHGRLWHLLPSVNKDAINDAQGNIFLSGRVGVNLRHAQLTWWRAGRRGHRLAPPVRGVAGTVLVVQLRQMSSWYVGAGGRDALLTAGRGSELSCCW